MVRRHPGWILALLVCLLASHDASAARKLRATGFYRTSTGQIALPLQFVSSAPGNTGMQSIHVGFPNGDPQLDADVTVTGMSPAGFTLAMDVVSGSYSALLALMGTADVQLSTAFEFRAPAAASGAMFSALGGPGAFSFCPGSVPGLPGAACPVTPMGAPDLAAPPQGSGTRNGRVVYLGGGGFGGVSQILLAGSGSVGAPRAGFGFGSPVFQAAHGPIAGAGVQPSGGPTGTVLTRFGAPFVFTQPRTAPATDATIAASRAGPHVTSMNALTSCPATALGGAYPNIPLSGSLACVTGTGPWLTSPGATSTFTAFPFTTGTVIVQQTADTGANPVGDLVTLTGSDARTPSGIGNVTLVAGGLVQRSGATAGRNASSQQITLTFSPKVPSLSRSGLAAAAVLVLLGFAWGRRR